MIHDVWFAQSLADLCPMFGHVLKLNILYEELRIGMMLLDPSPDDDDSAKSSAVLAVETLAWVMTLGIGRSFVARSVWQQSKLGEIHTFWSCRQTHDGVLGTIGDVFLREIIDVMHSTDAMLDFWISVLGNPSGISALLDADDVI